MSASVSPNCEFEGNWKDSLESMRFYLWLMADRTLDESLKPKIAPSDIVQQTMLEAHRDAEQFHGQTRRELRAWLRAILIHNIRNTQRAFHSVKREIRREREGGFDDLMVAGSEKSPSSMAAFEEEFRLLELALRELPPEYRQAIEYRSFRQLSFAEVGEKLGRSPEAARKLWNRGVHLLQRRMSELK